MWLGWQCMEIVNADWYYREVVSLDQATRNLTCGDADCCGVRLYCIRLITLNVSQWFNG